MQKSARLLFFPPTPVSKQVLLSRDVTIAINHLCCRARGDAAREKFSKARGGAFITEEPNVTVEVWI